MKKLLGFMLMGAAMLSSCGNDHEDLYDPNAIALQKANEYAKAFVAQFGDIDPNHTWGFDGVSRGVNANQNQWKNYLAVPEAITSDEIERVSAYFSDKDNNVHSTSIDYSDFFVQHVTGTSYKNQMNHLLAGGEHVYNFNAGGTITLMENGSSASFGYNNNMDSQDHSEYIILCIDGSYYVGFDFCANGQNPNQQHEADGVYNDWIVKVVPARNLRVIAEDLGDNSGDFDFNDVVFDVIKCKDGTAVIRLQAAGGTLPLYLQCGQTKYEVHEQFGVPVETMVNTGGTSKASVDLTFYNCQSINDIQIIVVDGDVTCNITAEYGEAPGKICVSTAYDWTLERQSIHKRYPKFAQYVQDHSVVWY